MKHSKIKDIPGIMSPIPVNMDEHVEKMRKEAMMGVTHWEGCGDTNDPRHANCPKYANTRLRAFIDGTSG